MHVLLVLLVMVAAVVVMVVIGPRALGRRRWPRQRGRRPAADAHDAAARMVTLGRDVGEFSGRRLCRSGTGTDRGQIHRRRRRRRLRPDLSRGHRRRRLFQYRVRLVLVLVLVLVLRRHADGNGARLHHLQQPGGTWKRQPVRDQ